MSNTIYHWHHIVPKHAGGTDDSSNLIKLTIQEHAEAHRKLYEQHGRWQDKCAWLSLSKQITHAEATKMAQIEANKGPKTGRRLQATIENGLKGATAWKGQHHTEEAKKQISKKNKKYWQGRPKSWLRKRINIDGTIYNGVAEVVKKYKVTRQTVYNRIKNPDLNWDYVITK